MSRAAGGGNVPISHEHRCLFVHIPRTGGTSIEKMLGIHRDWPTLHWECLHGRLTLGSEEYQLQHLSYLEAAQFIPNSSLVGCFTFTIVRNPWDRIVSEYFWRGGDGAIENFTRFVKRVRNWVVQRHELIGRNCHLRPQVEFLDAPGLFVGRFENLNSDVGRICERLQLNGLDLPHEMKTGHRHYTQYYTDAARNCLEEAYGQDIEAFGYSFGD